MSAPSVLSFVQAEPILRGRDAGQKSVASSEDLGMTRCEVQIEPDGVRFPSGEFLSWDSLQAIANSPQGCFVIRDGAPRKVQMFSEQTDRHYSLMPTDLAPTMLVSGIPMHRVKGTDPYHDTLTKIKAARPVVGRVLDTATGLGYTAIEAAKTAEQVVTIELDPVVLELAAQNPWSQALFNNPQITQLIGDSSEKVAEFEDGAFSVILHDPPTLSLAGEMYSGECYRQLFRVLRKGGRLFHYIGDPNSSLGHRVTKGVARRLQEAGFARIVYRPDAFGLVAFKTT